MRGLSMPTVRHRAIVGVSRLGGAGSRKNG
jgi:hypothetical protein